MQKKGAKAFHHQAKQLPNEARESIRSEIAFLQSDHEGSNPSRNLSNYP